MDDHNNRNFILAIALSILVLVVWQVFYVGPRMEEEEARQREAAKTQQQQQASQAPGARQNATGTPGTPSGEEAGSAPRPGGVARSDDAISIAPGASRTAAVARTERIGIDTPRLRGSLPLTGGRIDDLVLKDYHQTADEESDNVALLSPSGSPSPYFAEYGWVADRNATPVPGPETVWSRQGNGPLTPSSPVVFTWDNGDGVIYTRTVSVDQDYMFTVRQQVQNTGSEPVTLFPYARVYRDGQPTTTGFWVVYEGMLGLIGDEGEQRIGYDDVFDDGNFSFNDKTGGWLGFTDKYWAAMLIPDQQASYRARFVGNERPARRTFQTDYIRGAVTIAPGATESVEGKLFAGAKEVTVVDRYNEELAIKQFDLLIDWGWFYFITRPLFDALHFFHGLIGNFGVAILIVTVLIKLIFFPLANKSYVSMSKMKKLQPEMKKLQERYKDDRARQQQALMELYKKEKVNPMSGCLPILVQIPVFFALYKVLFVTIEMRHAPFFGWIQDLSARDPTSIFNLFGLLPFSVPEFLMVGVWPVIMGISMWFQMKLNPAPQDPVQQKIFAWMPLVFTFILAPFPAGLVIYWTWNNILSVMQQWLIMSRQGVKVELWDNLKSSFNWLNTLKNRNNPAE